MFLNDPLDRVGSLFAESVQRFVRNRMAMARGLPAGVAPPLGLRPPFFDLLRPSASFGDF
eukprot:10145112-Heterocapsa_arctica.AAC.1